MEFFESLNIGIHVFKFLKHPLPSCCPTSDFYHFQSSRSPIRLLLSQAKPYLISKPHGKVMEWCLEQLLLSFWNSDHMVSKSSIHTLASPWQQWSDLGLGVTQNEQYLISKYTNQLLFVKFCDRSAGNEASILTHKQGGTEDGRKDRQTWKLK